ncbi:MAG: ImmA/IrrE family metallo-endopeptidase [Pseudomonadota bacterium]
MAHAFCDAIRDLYGEGDNIDVAEALNNLYDHGAIALKVLPDHILGDDEAIAYPNEQRIEIKESVYLGAHDQVPKDRFTISHELGHLFLKHQASFSRATIRRDHKTYQDSEWQADTFAAELLMDSRRIDLKKDTVQTLTKRFGVSYQAAEVRLRKLNNENR